MTPHDAAHGLQLVDGVVVERSERRLDVGNLFGLGVCPGDIDKGLKLR
jgi:hypothetical protein